MNIHSLVIRNIARRKTRSLLTVIGLGAAIAAVVALVGIANGFQDEMSQLYGKRGIDLVVQTKGGAQQLNSGIHEKLRYDIEKIEVNGQKVVSQVVGGLMDVVSFEKEELYTVIVNGWPLDCPQFNDLKYLEGRRLEKGETRKVNLGYVLAKNLGKKVGDKVELYAEEYEVVGIFESFSVYENGCVVLLLEELQRLMDRPGQVTGFLIDVTPVENDPQATQDRIVAVNKAIEALSSKLNVTPTQDFVENVDQIKLGRSMAWIVSAIAVFIGSIGVLNTMVMSVIERTREIGTLRAIGWKRHRVMRMILWESVFLSFGGAILGVILAVLLMRALSNLSWTSGLIAGRTSPGVIFQGFAIAIIVGVLGAAYPAYRAASLSPMEALRKK
jgi:putative ABC transport system permease protein